MSWDLLGTRPKKVLQLEALMSKIAVRSEEDLPREDG